MDTLSFFYSCKPNNIYVRMEARTLSDNTVTIFSKADGTVLLDKVVQYNVFYRVLAGCNRMNIAQMLCINIPHAI